MRDDVDDPFDRLSDQDVADTCALADGTLPTARRAQVEALVRDSPELTALLGRQRRALAATAAKTSGSKWRSIMVCGLGLR